MDISKFKRVKRNLIQSKKITLTFDCDLDGIGSSAVLVGGTDFIDAGIFSDSLEQIQSTETEVINSSEPATHLQGLAVVEPLHLHGRVGVRFETALYMSALALP